MPDRRRRENRMFPMDWDEWRAEWHRWERQHANVMQPIRFIDGGFRFPRMSILADAILGTWTVNGRPVELSELTMPDFSAPATSYKEVRRVGITWGLPDGTIESGGVVATFADLEKELGIK